MSLPHDALADPTLGPRCAESFELLDLEAHEVHNMLFQVCYVLAGIVLICTYWLVLHLLLQNYDCIKRIQ